MKPEYKHFLVIKNNLKVAARGRPRKSPAWKIQSELELEAWEWRMILHMGWINPERRREILKMIAVEAVEKLVRFDFPEGLKSELSKEIIKQSEIDSSPEQMPK